MKQIAAALVNAKKAFGPALKDKANPHFRSKYADLGACIDAVDDALLANGIAVYQETFDDASGVTVETVFLHQSGESLRCGKLHVPAAKQDPQGYGSALTYARRYSLMAACGIAPEDDDGNAASRPAPVQTIQRGGVAKDVLQESPAIPPARQQEIGELWSKVAEDFESYGAQAAYERIEEEGLDNLEKIFLSTLMPSNVRNAITAYSRSIHSKPKAA